MSHAAMAEEEIWDGRFYVAPGLTYNIIDDDIGVEDDAGFHIAFGKPISRHFNIELQAMDWNGTDANAEADMTAFGVNLLWFPDRYSYPLYGLLGVMDSDFEISNGAQSVDQDGTLLDIGFGYLQTINQHGTALRWEYRFRQNDAETRDFDDHVVMLALQIPLGAKPMPPPPPPPPPPPAPPPPAPAPAPAPEPEPEPEPEQLVVLEGVHFEFDSHQLTPVAKGILDEAVTAMNTRTDIETVVVGHTCNMGPADYNEQLSHKRANSVRDYLVAQGVEGNRIMSRGYGEALPVASNDTKEGRMQNRRVEVTVIDSRLCLPPLPGDQTDASGCAVIK